MTPELYLLFVSISIKEYLPNIDDEIATWLDSLLDTESLVPDLKTIQELQEKKEISLLYQLMNQRIYEELGVRLNISLVKFAELLGLEYGSGIGPKKFSKVSKKIVVDTKSRKLIVSRRKGARSEGECEIFKRHLTPAKRERDAVYVRESLLLSTFKEIGAVPAELIGSSRPDRGFYFKDTDQYVAIEGKGYVFEFRKFLKQVQRYLDAGYSAVLVSSPKGSFLSKFFSGFREPEETQYCEFAKRLGTSGEEYVKTELARLKKLLSEKGWPEKVTSLLQKAYAGTMASRTRIPPVSEISSVPVLIKQYSKSNLADLPEDMKYHKVFGYLDLTEAQ